MLGLGSVLSQQSLEEQNNYKSLTGLSSNNVLIVGSYDSSAGIVSLPHSTGHNGIPFSTNYTTSSTFRGSYTVSMWYKSADGRDIHRGSKTLFSFGGGETSSDYFYLMLGSTGLFTINGVINGAPILALTANQNLADGAIDWHHLALTVTGGGGSNTVFAVYVNGVAATVVNILSISSANHAAADADGGAYVNGTVSTAGGLGASPSLFDYDFIDDFCLHSSALDADNIAAIYNSGTPINLLANSGNYDTSGDVVLYYKFNGAKNTSGTGLDSHGTSNATGGNFSTESAS